MVSVWQTHTKFAVSLPWSAGKSDNNILGYSEVKLLLVFQVKRHSFFTVYIKNQSFRFQVHSQLYPLLPGEGVPPRKAKAGNASTLSLSIQEGQIQSVIEGGGDDLEDGRGRGGEGKESGAGTRGLKRHQMHPQHASLDFGGQQTGVFGGKSQVWRSGTDPVRGRAGRGLQPEHAADVIGHV